MSNKKNNDKVVSDKHLELTCRKCGEKDTARNIRDDPDDDAEGLIPACAGETSVRPVRYTDIGG